MWLGSPWQNNLPTWHSDNVVRSGMPRFQSKHLQAPEMEGTLTGPSELVCQKRCSTHGCSEAVHVVWKVTTRGFRGFLNDSSIYEAQLWTSYWQAQNCTLYALHTTEIFAEAIQKAWRSAASHSHWLVMQLSALWSHLKAWSSEGLWLLTRIWCYVGMVFDVMVGRQATFEKPAPQEKHATRKSVTLSPEYTRNKEAPSPLFFFQPEWHKVSVVTQLHKLTLTLYRTTRKGETRISVTCG